MALTVDIKSFAGLFLTATLLFVTDCVGAEIAWRSFEGNISTIKVYPEDTFLDVISQLQKQQGLMAPEAEYLIDFLTASSTSAKSFEKSIDRHYRPLSSNEKKDIAYIITTLGNASLASIASSKSSIKKAGDRIETVHPFQLLGYVFGSEKLKAAMHNLKGRTLWIWSEFFNGLKRSFEEEATKDNLNDYVAEFASTLELDNALLSPLVRAGKWKELIDTLFTELPRKGETDRYDL